MALTTQLISYWKMDEAGFGLTRVDTVGPNHLLDNSGDVDSNPGLFGNAAQFTSGNDGLTCTDPPTLQVSANDWTWVAWIRVTNTNTGGIVGRFTALDLPDSTFFLERLVGGLIRFRTWSGSTPTAISSAAAPSINVWHMCACGWDNAAGRMWLQVDLATQVTAVAGLPNSGEGISVEVGKVDQGTTLTGRVDELGFWMRKLSTVELSQLYNGGVGIPYPLIPVAAAAGDGFSVLLKRRLLDG